MSIEDHKQALPAGYRLGSYRVARVLGAGGFGVTYLCEHLGFMPVAAAEWRVRPSQTHSCLSGR